MSGRKHSHYFKDVARLESVDVYRVLLLWGVSDPCLQHAIKKLLCAGQRGAKSAGKDVREAIESCQRWEEMRAEDSSERPQDGDNGADESTQPSPATTE